MLWIAAIVLSTLSGTLGSDESFPHGFRFGVATSAYQVEGAWNDSVPLLGLGLTMCEGLCHIPPRWPLGTYGFADFTHHREFIAELKCAEKGESVWDRVTHIYPHDIADGGNGDVACDSYRQWRRDVDMVHEMGLHFYRFSISWTRLVPNAFTTKVSESGKKYYNDLINYLLEKNIEPIVTLYHWDLPQKLQDLGGWTNPLVSDWFADYARIVFSLYADRVKTWITLNEPLNMCELNYNVRLLAPLILEPDVAGLLCNKHVLVAHAKAWRIYDKEYKPMYHDFYDNLRQDVVVINSQGKVSIANHLIWMEPKGEGDEAIAQLAMESCTGQYSHPIYSKHGGWPPSVEKAMAEYSKKAGYVNSKLPSFTKEEISLVKGTYDFYALNYYTSRLVRRAFPGENPGIWSITGRPEFNIILEMNPKWKITGNPLTPMYPKGLRKGIAWLKQQYGDLEFFITENGCTDPEPYDHVRMKFMASHLKQILFSIKEDGTNITAYTYWTLMDNFEWRDGYGPKFGLYEVDFKDPMRTRTPRTSAYYYSHIVRKHSLGVPFPKEPSSSERGIKSSATHSKDYWNYLTNLLGLCLVFLSCPQL